MAEAKAYPAKVASLLDKYRKKHGVYPSKIDSLPAKPKTPRLANFTYGTDDGRSYYFRFPEPGAMISFSEWVYESRTRTWEFVAD